MAVAATIDPQQLLASSSGTETMYSQVTAQQSAPAGTVSPQHALSMLTPDQLRGMVQRARMLMKLMQRDEEQEAELARIRAVLQYYQQYHRAQAYQQHAYLAHQRAHAASLSAPSANGWASKPSPSPENGESQPLPNGVSPSTTTLDPTISAILSGPLPPEPEPNQPVIFTPTQLNTLRYQIYAFKLLSRGLPLPAHVQLAIQRPEEAVEREEETVALAGKTTMDRIVDSAVRAHVGAKAQGTNGDIDMHDVDEESSGDLTNGGVIPFTHLKRPRHPFQRLEATKYERMLISPTTPMNLDPQMLLAERDHFVEARVNQRVRELEALPITFGQGGGPKFKLSDLTMDIDEAHDEVKPTSGRLRTIIELKALKLREKQRQLRQDVIATYTRSSFINQSSTRAALTKLRQQTVRDARTTEVLEKKQRDERIRKSKQKQLDYLQSIINHGRDMLAARKAAVQNSQRFGKMVLRFHADWEKEEQRRLERLSKDRLKALKNDDEEAYMKLVDTAKDTRITHLLKKTNEYLENLTQGILAQQKAAGVSAILSDEAPVTEATFGANGFDDGEPANDKQKADYYAVAHRVQEKITEQPSILVGGSLKDYQLKGLQWMVSLYNNKLNGILADEMGLGKTIQTISLVTFLIEKKRQPGPYLVIVPLSTLTNWTLEFQKWAPSVHTIVYKGSPPVRKQIQHQIRHGGFQVLLTTYEYIIKDRLALSKLRWLYMIIDEGHRMKNTQSRLSTTLTTFYTSRYRLILTGTPLQNNLPELWALLNFILPHIFNSSESFMDWFSRPFANTGGQEKLELNEEEALLVIRGLHKVLRPFLLRRLKKDVESELPDKTEKIIKCRMSALQARMYDWMKKYKAVLTIAGDGKARATGGKGVNNTIMQLRKICNHPFVFPAVDTDINMGRVDTDPNIYRAAGKFELIDRMLPKLFRCGHRVLIFFQMTEVMTIFEDYCNYRHYRYLRLDGMTKSEDRGEAMKKFNEKDSPYSLFLLSTRAGGLGLNLQTADTVIIFDSDWNPHADLQAQDRAHRIGQKKAVSVFRLITDKSVEEHMLARARDKLDMDGKVIQAGRFDQKTSAQEQENLLRLLLEADAADDQEESVEMTNDELNEILARGDEEEEIFQQMDKELDARDLAEWRAKGHIGPLPERLMQDSELPYEYLHPKAPEELKEEELLAGRGQRVKGPVMYTDGLTDDQFLRALEEDGTDFAEIVEKKRQRRERQAAKKAAFAAGLLTVDNSARGTPESPFDQDSATPDLSRATSQLWTNVNGTSTAPSPAANGDGTPVPKGRKRKRYDESFQLVVDGEADGSRDEPGAKRLKAEEVQESGKKGRKANPFRDRLKKVFLQAFQQVQNSVSDDGHYRTAIFKELPDPTMYPDYYGIITNPIALSVIKRRTYAGYYRSVPQFREDWKLMFDNARSYNTEESQVYEDAVVLEKELDDIIKKLTYGTDLPGAEGGTNPVSEEETKPNGKEELNDEDSMDVDEPPPPPPPEKKPLKIKVKLRQPA
ncbi:hypothetical protein DACRYDRAFT_74776 [Dacryopinax primogenitus]|uniref:SNF2-family ATP dependent chromatin remodeling factor snf21 n=1 Tax=Dacryopinax primogenitus (strain DJM 731) TaxID=1858805 RepID=M5G5K0_DACPD|nr:uncharacterized protein DACRYDRAFT_74776 [Dacryopinax primogenitus]EJU05536.1 hypothetical protein DACRYDRAFT_74776 [Dacryopinax primogenitus]